MSEYTLANKYTLGVKETVQLPITGLNATLVWHAPVDLDLMFFYRATDGREGAVFSPNIKKGDGTTNGTLGTTSAFPFISLSGDEGVDESEGAKSEEGRIENLSEMAEIHIFAVNWSDAEKGADTTFSSYDGLVQVMDDSGEHNFDVPLSSTEHGYFAHLATIKGDGSMTRVDKVMGIGADFFENIPAAKLLFV